jgi:hypothetical protein
MIEQQLVIFAFNMSIVVAIITVLSFETDRRVLPALRALRVKV